MTLDINAVEWFWVLVNALALGFQTYSLGLAYSRLSTVRALNGKAREISAEGNVRREVLRVVVQLLLLSIVVPGLFSPSDIRLTPPLISLLLIPVFVCLNSALDARDTFRLMRLADDEIESERVTTLTRIEAAIDRQTEATVAAIEGASEDVSGHRSGTTKPPT